MTQFANPKKFEGLANKLLPIITSLCISFLAIGVYITFFQSPPDYQQGITVRIMYVHVPSSWLAMGVYFFVGLSSLIYVVWRHNLAILVAKAAAPVGATFALCSLVTGSIWGKPMWGTWWAWDARLTSMLMLFVLYLGYIFVHHITHYREKAYFSSSVIAMIGLINLPIIKFSVNWWHTLHQPASILRSGGPSIHSSMLVPLALMTIGFACLGIALILLRIKSELLEQKIQAHYKRLASQELGNFKRAA